jgi:3-hydroxyacyl-CoA dehydrogenase
MAAVNSVVDLTLDGEVAVITLDAPPVNALTAEAREGLFAAFGMAHADAAAKAIVLICGGRTFIAGADIGGLGKAAVGPGLRDVQAQLESTPKPVIVAIHGSALGGGLELALCANYRVATRSAKVGLPEVNLGILPGAGGTQRLPRIVGVEKALQMITGGAPVSASEALKVGLVDELVDDGALRQGAIEFARRVLALPELAQRVSQIDGKVAEARGRPEIFADFRKANARKFRGYIAPEAAIKAIEGAVNLPFAEGCKEERRLMEELVAGPQSAAQRYVFFAERAAAKLADVPGDTPLREVRKVGVLGAGTMGSGIAISFVNAGYDVCVVESKQEALDRGLGVIRATVTKDAERAGKTPEQVEHQLSHVRGSLELEAFRDADLIVEAIFEDMAVKKDVFAKLDAVAKPGAILASNTSFLNIDEIAAATSRPQDVLGMHYFAPANIMKLLEIVRGEKTAKDVLATAMQIAKKTKKVAVVARVCEGFIGNRMLRKRGEQAEALVIDGARPERIDELLYDFGFPMGPFQMKDVVGMDVIKDQPGQRTLWGAMTDAGRLGQKGIGGFYNYDAKRNRSPSPEAAEVIERFRQEKGAVARDISDEEIMDRCLLLIINEGAKILEEGVAQRASDIDAAWIAGYGWPSYRGGPMYYADHDLGLQTIVDKLTGYAARLGEAWRPARLLEQLAREGRTFEEFAS